MEVMGVETTKKEKIYELTESEYEKLLNKARNYGAQKTKEYIGFCWNNYYWKKNIKGMTNFIRDLIYFLEDRSDSINNVYSLSFWDWLKRNKYE